MAKYSFSEHKFQFKDSENHLKRQTVLLNLDDPENAKILLKKENRYFLKRHSRKYSVYVVLKAYAPKIADFYYRIRK